MDPTPPPWTSQDLVGAVPGRNDSFTTRGQFGVASCPVSASMEANSIPRGGSNLMFGRPARARFMKAVHIGSAA